MSTTTGKILGGTGRFLDDRVHGARGRPRLPAEDLPRPLVVPARRDRALLVHHPAAHRHVPDAVLPAQHDRRRLPRLLHAAGRRAHERGVRVHAEHQLRRARRAADAADPPLGGDPVRGRDRVPPAAGVLHRRVPQAARAQLAHRGGAVHPGVHRGPVRLLAARRPAVRHRAAHPRGRAALDPDRRHLPELLPVRRAVPRASHHPAAVHHPRPADPRHPAGADRRAPVPDVPPEAHPDAGQGPHRQERGRPADVPVLHGEDRGLVLLHLRRDRAAVHLRADQPDLDLRPVQPLGHLRGLAARLVHGLHGGRPADVAELALERRSAIRSPSTCSCPRSCRSAW